MTLPEPFAYPRAPHPRRHGPAGYKDYESFKDWLRDEFAFRCAYCLFRERWYPNGSMSFSVDHVIPRSVDRGAPLEREYSNLVYACNRCNSLRGVEEILDPTRSSLGDHLGVRPGDGSIVGLTDEGRDSIQILRLNAPPLREYRRRVLIVLELKREYPNDLAMHDLFMQTFSYPDDLPDLRRLKPPLGNTKAPSAESCYFALRERGELQAVY